MDNLLTLNISIILKYVVVQIKRRIGCNGQHFSFYLYSYENRPLRKEEIAKNLKSQIKPRNEIILEDLLFHFLGIYFPSNVGS